MEHLAIDLGGRESQVCLRAEGGTVLHEGKVPTRELEELLRSRPKCRVVMETCAEAFSVADAAMALGHETRVVPAMLVRGLGVGARNLKNDRRDAQALSAASCRMDLPSVHIPSAWARETKSLCAARDRLVSSRTTLINGVQGWLRGARIRLRKGEPESFHRRLIEALTSEPPDFVQAELRVIEQLNQEIRQLDKTLKQRAKSDPDCVRLMSVPGVGPQTALRFKAAIDDVSRFSEASQLESYLGLTPGEDSSSERTRRTSITKAGSKAARWLLIESCWTMKRCRPNDPMVLWGDRVMKRRGKRIGVVAMARKLAGILYALWRDQTTYDPKQSALGEPPAA